MHSLPPYETFEHTADSGIIARGCSLGELFEHAAEGMFALMVDLSGVHAREERRIAVSGRDLEGLLVNWLSELLYYLDAEELLLCKFRVSEIDETHIVARAFGERVDRDRHDLLMGVKAITRHMLDVHKTSSGYEAKVLFDI